MVLFVYLSHWFVGIFSVHKQMSELVKHAHSVMEFSKGKLVLRHRRNTQIAKENHLKTRICERMNCIKGIDSLKFFYYSNDYNMQLLLFGPKSGWCTIVLVVRKTAK